MDPQAANPTSADSDADAWALLADNGIDTAWLTATLNDAGYEGAVTDIEPALVGTGQVGENVRCRLTWDDRRSSDDPADRPGSLVVKLASSNEASRAAAAATKTYIREVGFYRDVADSVAIRVPRVYGLSEDRSANSFVLAMEDIAPAAAGDQLAGCSIDQALLGVEAAADLHGSTWARPELEGLEWIDPVTPQRRQERVDLFLMFYNGFVERYRDRLSAADLAFGAWLAGDFDRWVETRERADTATGHRCLVHGDFRLDNMLFGTSEPAPPLTTVDWQTPALGNGLSDVAYFLSGSLKPAELRATEGELLDRYRSRLGDHGVDLSADAAWIAYRMAAPGGFVMAVIASQLVGQTDRGDEMFMVMARGSATQSRELDTAALVT